MNRREFLARSAPAAGVVALGGGGVLLDGCSSNPSMPEPDVRPPLRLPRTIDASNAILAAGTAELDLGEHVSRAWGYDAAMPGPTLRARVGSDVSVRLLNHLTEDTTIHWHGMVVPSSMDGHPADAVSPGEAYDYEYPIGQRAAMNWYHPHPHGRTGRQVWRGLAGAFILDDPDSEQGLPSGALEIPLLLRDGLLDRSGQLEYRRRDSGLVGDFPLVNGVPYPRVTLPAALHRFRVLNAANARVFNLGMTSGARFTLIGNDGGLLENATPLDRIELGPAERVDVLVDLASHAGGTLSLRCFEAGWTLLEIAVRSEEAASARVRMDRQAFAPIPSLSASAGAEVREFRFEGHRRINGREYRMDRVDFQVPFGETERWRFVSAGGAPHPVHVHGTHFQVIARHGGRGQTFPWERGWKDTVLLRDDETVDVLVRFDRHRGLYLLHCHKLEHEDRGMMLNFEVT